MFAALLVGIGGPAYAADDAPLRCYDVEERARIAARIVAAEAKVIALENEIKSQPSPWLLAGVIVGAVIAGGVAGYGVAVAKAPAP